MSRLKILQVSNRVPYPLNEGGTIGIYNYTRGFYEAGCDVTLFALSANKHRLNEQEASDVLSKFCEYHAYPIDTDVKIIPALFNLFSNKSYNVERFYDLGFEQALRAHLKSHSYDVIQIEGTYPARFSEVIFQHRNSAKVVLRQHNVEFQIWERLASNAKNPIKKWYLSLLSKRLKRFEQKHLNQYDALVPVTKDDGELFEKMGCTIPIFPSPAGIDTTVWCPSTIEVDTTVYHIGSLEWMANVEAVEWYLNEVWPKVLAAHPHLTFEVAGKGMSHNLTSKIYPNTTMVGEVDNAPLFISDKGITVVPLKSGSGIRLKILEAMAAGKLVISTTIGAQGIAYTNGLDILIADSPEQFVTAFDQIISDPVLYHRIKRNARTLIVEKYSNVSVVHRLLTFYENLK